MDYKFLCPHCSQHLEGPAELAGLEVNCPVCGNLFIVCAPAKASETAKIEIDYDDDGGVTRKRHWVVDLRVLVSQAPPVYLQTLVEVPTTWDLPRDGRLPEAASEVVKRAVTARYPRCPVTTTKVHVAGSGELRRISEHTDYANDLCRAWMLGRMMATV